ncbi:MAG: hypothetical protein QM288_00250 [Bacteroidota bacterium]|nr:hypothetical protein [Bacteroidota bacterium]
MNAIESLFPIHKANAIIMDEHRAFCLKNSYLVLIHSCFLGLIPFFETIYQKCGLHNTAGEAKCMLQHWIPSLELIRLRNFPYHYRFDISTAKFHPFVLLFILRMIIFVFSLDLKILKGLCHEDLR